MASFQDVIVTPAEAGSVIKFLKRAQLVGTEVPEFAKVFARMVTIVESDIDRSTESIQKAQSRVAGASGRGYIGQDDSLQNVG